MSFETKKCYHDHPALPVGDGKVIYGGNGEHPVHDDGDVYVALDHFTPTPRAMPWNPGEHFRYPLTDGQGPKNHDEFAKLIEWLSDQIDAGKKVHVGCIGGHGRTGTVLAALVSHRHVAGLMANEDNDYIGYVRKHYCKKAVESKAQVDYLVEKWGAKKVDSSYSMRAVSTKNSSFDWHDGNAYQKGGYGGTPKYKPIYSSEGPAKSKGHSGIDSGTPFRGDTTIWSKRVVSSVAMSK